MIYKRLFTIFFLLPIFLLANKNYKNFTVKNQCNHLVKDAFVSIPLSKIKILSSDFEINNLKIFDNEKEIPYQIDEDKIIFVVDLEAREKKKLNLVWNDKVKQNYKSRTYAELAMKVNGIFDGKKFRGDKFEKVQKVKVPAIHSDHDALFKYEGPGWESEKIGYRFYLDWRNATDIFGKKVNALVLENVGINDTLAENDSYHSMQNWGMDIFKVGSSLGIGSIGMYSSGKVNMVSKTDSIICEISKNGPIKSEVKTNYFGWLVDNKKFNLESKFSIIAGSRLSKHSIVIDGNADNLVTGLAKYEGINFLKSKNKNGWNYIALYGKQSLAGDDLGIAVFYNQKDFIELTEDEFSHIVKLKPSNGKLEYYIAAAWQQEYNGIKNKKEFEKFLKKTIEELNKPVLVKF